jgi:hypothetical protein
MSQRHAPINVSHLEALLQIDKGTGICICYHINLWHWQGPTGETDCTDFVGLQWL